MAAAAKVAEEAAAATKAAEEAAAATKAVEEAAAAIKAAAEAAAAAEAVAAAKTAEIAAALAPPVKAYDPYEDSEDAADAEADARNAIIAAATAAAAAAASPAATFTPPAPVVVSGAMATAPLDAETNEWLQTVAAENEVASLVAAAGPALAANGITYKLLGKLTAEEWKEVLPGVGIRTMLARAAGELSATDVGSELESVHNL